MRVSNQGGEETNYTKIGGLLYGVPILLFLLLVGIWEYFRQFVIMYIVYAAIDIDANVDLDVILIVITVIKVLIVLALFIWWAKACVLFIKKKIQFPKYMIGFLGFYTVVIIGEYIYYWGMNDFLFFKVLRIFMLSAICIPYFLKSKRVKGTFLH